MTYAYLAGALDADGYFTIKRDTYGLRVKGDRRSPTFQERIGFKQVTPSVRDLLKETFGGSIGIQRPSAPHGRPLFSWEVRNVSAAGVARILLPYLITKRQQAELILNLRQLRDKGKSGSIVVQQKDRWGTMRGFRKLTYSEEDIRAFQDVFETIKSLNDTRTHQAKLG